MTQTANPPQPSADARARILDVALQEAAAAQADVASQAKELENLEGRVTQLRLKVNDLETHRNQLAERLVATDGPERARLSKLVGEAQHDLAAAQIELDMTNKRLDRALARMGTPARAGTIQPAPDSFPRPQDIITMWTSGMVLLLPFVLVLARRLWVRGVRREPVDLENSPRLQRIEQAVEAIAVEVERIGEAQRFTTKLFAERQLDAAPRIPVQPRREPGTITPH
jgi:hypothetical protein